MCTFKGNGNATLDLSHVHVGDLLPSCARVPPYLSLLYIDKYKNDGITSEIGNRLSVCTLWCVRQKVAIISSIFVLSRLCNRVQNRAIQRPKPVFVNLLRSPEIDSRPGGPVQQPYLTYRRAGLHRLAESLPRNRFLGSINVYKYGLSSSFCICYC